MILIFYFNLRKKSGGGLNDIFGKLFDRIFIIKRKMSGQ